MEKLTIEKLKQLTPHSILKQGELSGKRYVAIRGVIHDWAIYQDNEFTINKDIQSVIDIGTKVIDIELIKKMLPCDTESLEMYRF